MARHLKKLNNYPQQFFRLVEQTQREGEMFIPIQGDTVQATKNMKISLRSQLYSFFAAIRKEAEEWENRKGDKGPIWAMKHVKFAEQTAVRAEEGGLRLIQKDNTPMAGLLGRALELSREKLGMESWKDEQEREFMKKSNGSEKEMLKKLGIISEIPEEGETIAEKTPGWDEEIKFGEKASNYNDVKIEEIK